MKILPEEFYASIEQSGQIPPGWKPARGLRKVKVKNQVVLAAPRLHYPGEWQSVGSKNQMTILMSQPVKLSFIELLDNPALSAAEVRRLVGWQALVLVDLLRRRCVTVRYSERILFNLEVVQRLERRRLQDCVEVVDWGMQLEDWEAHTPEHLSEALAGIAQLAQELLKHAPLAGKQRSTRQVAA